MPDLHARLLAAITRRRELAEAAEMLQPSPWSSSGRRWGSVLAAPGFGHVAHDVEDAACGDHIAANDPAQILRDTTAHLRVLERHKPREAVVAECSVCIERIDDGGNCGHYAPDWPCPDIEDLASVYPEVTE